QIITFLSQLSQQHLIKYQQPLNHPSTPGSTYRTVIKIELGGYSLMSAGLYEARIITGAPVISLGAPESDRWSEDMTASESALIQTPATVQVPMYRRLFATAGNLYCHLFHSSISRPVAGKYRCWKCLREFDLEW